MSASDDISSHNLRLCKIRSTNDGRGFGFNMQAEKGRTGQFIGVVDADTPAERAGLRNGDRIIEVNSVNVEGDSHKQAVEKIKAIPNLVELLVVDPEADLYFTSKGTPLSSSLSCVIKSENHVGKHNV